MPPKPVGKLTKIDPRKVWKDEAADFTPWVKDNIDHISEIVGLDIDLLDSEVSVGPFSCDLVGKDMNLNQTIIIENQLEQSDHDHLGKIITYATDRDAGVVIWVSPKFRKEHAKALDWLNKISDGKIQFFGIRVEMLQIDDSLPAPRFQVVAQPSEWELRPPTQRGEKITDRQKKYHDFFTDFLETFQQQYPGVTKKKSVGYHTYFGFPLIPGKSGLWVGASFVKGKVVTVNLYIDFGDKGRNAKVYDKLYEEKDEIEAQLKLKLIWKGLLGKRAHGITTHREGSIDGSKEELTDIKEWFLKTMMPFSSVLSKKIDKS